MRLEDARGSFMRGTASAGCGCGVLERFDDFDETDAEFTPPPNCVTPGNPTILHCFVAHRTNLIEDHRRELDRIIIKLTEAKIDKRPIKRVHIVGHAATWRGITPRQYKEAR